MKRFYLVLMVLFVFFCACEKEPRGQYPVESVAPGEVTSPQVKNIKGGAIISYNLPDDRDLLYVKATYELSNGKTMEQKASAYKHSIKIVGFGKSQQATVQLSAYDQSNNESDPITVDIHPLDASIYAIFKSLKVYSDFGGIRLEWENPETAEVVIEVYTLNEDRNLVNMKNFYTKAENGISNIRGISESTKVFGVSIRDHWDNHTDTLVDTYHPLYESKLDKSKFALWNPPGIPYIALGGWGLKNAWDGSIGTPGFSTPSGYYPPQDITFDMGQLAKLSRFVINSRGDDGDPRMIYNFGQFEKFTVWGSPTPNVSADTSSWIKVGDFESHKPSGLPLGQFTQEDVETAVIKGENYDVPSSVPPIRYIRMTVEKTWGGSVLQLTEITFHGDIK